ncbi:hypothetical protein [Chitinophaga sp. HK235]|uniref:hypothetical protein n=1 Tax=Chitinophaga sp. HK235 TaxID=2952571 RepID=UPI001BAB79DF|nr:hypothetical protein [Chitinophaga sp. HK235]
MITGIDYILYTKESQDVFIQKMKDSLTFWDNPYYVVDNEDETTDIFVSKDEKMFRLMDEKGFYTLRGSGEGPFMVMFNSKYSSDRNRITLVLPKEIDKSKFAQKVFNWIKSIL